MSELEKENQKLKEELETIRKSEHEKSGIIKVISFLAVAVFAGYVQTISPLAALALGAAGFWFIFMR